MKKYLLSLCAAAVALSASAQATVFPPQGNVPTQGEVATRGGLSSVTLTANGAEINRTCEGFVVLSKDGQQVMAVPASNERRIKLDSDGDPESASSDGTQVIRINFWDGSLATSPFIYNGSYSMMVPSGLYTINGEPNKAYIYNWTITDNAYSATISTVPANNSTVQTLSVVTVTFEGAANVELANASGIYAPDPFYVSSGQDGVDGTLTDIVPSVSISGNVATLTFPEVIEKECNLSLYIEDGAFKADDVAVTGTVVNIKVTGVPQAVADIDITPVPGSYAGGIPATKANFPLNSTTGEAYTIFTLALPDDVVSINQKNMLMAGMQKKYGMQDAAGNYVSDAKLTYKVASDNSAMYFVNNGYTGSISNWGYDTTLGLAPGEYYFFAAAGIFSYTREDGTVVSNPEIKWGPFIIEAANVNYTIDPVSGSTLDELKDFTITFPEDATLKLDTWNYWATVKNGAIVYDIKAEIVNNTVVVNNPAGIVTPGEYTFNIDGLLVNGAPFVVSAIYTVERQFISEVTVLNDGQPVDAAWENDCWNAEVTIPSGKALELEFILPVGYDSLYYRDNNSTIGGEDIEELSDENAGISLHALIPVDELTKPENGSYELAVDNKVKVKYGTNDLTIAYVVDGQATNPTPFMITVNNGNTTAVEAIEAVDAEAEYYTLQGVKVANPEKGIYIKVANGKAVKVVVE